MNNKRLLRAMIFIFLVMFLTTLAYSFSWAAQWGRTDKIELTLEELSELNRTAVLKLTFYCGWDIKDTRIGCFLPEGIELINDKNYKNEYMESGYGEWGHSVTFYEGSLKKNEKKIFKFKVHISDDKRYCIRASGGDATVDSLELDLGDPEPPELEPQNNSAGIKKIKSMAQGGMGQLSKEKLTILTAQEDSLPALRTELKARTKDKLYYEYWKDVFNRQPGKDILIPIRYLVYAENETPNLNASLVIPMGLEFVTDEKETYQKSRLEDGSTEVVFYSGPMRFKQSKAFYFKVKPLSAQAEEYFIQAKSELTTTEGKILLKEDKLSIDLKPKKF